VVNKLETSLRQAVAECVLKHLIQGSGIFAFKAAPWVIRFQIV